MKFRVKYVIFLDVDGVLNNTNYTTKYYDKYGKDAYFRVVNEDFDLFDPKSLKYIRKLVDTFGSELLIVISSTWRRNLRAYNKVIDKIMDGTNAYNVLIDRTEVRADAIRGLEIRDYLENNSDILEDANFVIIDDDDFDIIDYKDVPDYSHNFVKCSHEEGFKKNEYKRALKILRGDYVESYRRNI